MREYQSSIVIGASSASSNVHVVIPSIVDMFLDLFGRTELVDFLENV